MSTQPYIPPQNFQATITPTSWPTQAEAPMMCYRTYETAPWTEDLTYSMYWISYAISRGYEYQLKGRDY